MNLRLFFFVAMLFAGRASAQTVQQAVEDSVHRAIVEMDDEDFRIRQAGVQHMLELPPQALAYLDRVVSDNKESPEVISRVRENIERLRAKARQTAKVRRAAEIAEWEAIEAAKGYKAGPGRDARWDSSVADGFSRITSIYDGGNPDTWRLYPQAVFDPFQKAVAAGCRDSLVNAYYLRTGFNTRLLNDDPGRKVLPLVFPGIMNSAYSPALKFQAAIDFAWSAHFVDPDGQLWSATERWNALRTAADLWPGIVKDSSIPDVVLEELSGRFLDAGTVAEVGRLQIVELLLPAWQTARPTTAAVWSFKTAGYLLSADGLLHSNTERSDEEMKTLASRITTAREAGEKAYAADATDGWAPTMMIRVCNLDHPDREEMERWFDRAIGADPENLDACVNKLDFLATHEAPDDLLKFARDCALRGGGRLPLVLIRAHQLIANRLDSADSEAYIKSAEVWNEEQAVFTKFLAGHAKDPLNIYYRSLFAKCAAGADKWSIAKEQFDMLGDHPDIGVFNGLSAYNYLRKKAQRAVLGI